MYINMLIVYYILFYIIYINRFKNMLFTLLLI